jgi:hypothetical protein
MKQTGTKYKARAKARVGQRINGIVITGIAGKDRHGKTLVEFSCPDCGKVVVRRYSDLRRKPGTDKQGKKRVPTGSCGCRATKAFRENIKKMAGRIPEKARLRIWQDYQTLGTVEKAAKKNGLNRHVCQQVIHETSEALRQLWEIVHAGWIEDVQDVQERMKEDDQWHRGKLLHRQGELTPEELKAKGEIVSRARQILRRYGHLSEIANGKADEALRLAKWVLNAADETRLKRLKRGREYAQWVVKRRLASGGPPKQP